MFRAGLTLLQFAATKGHVPALPFIMEDPEGVAPDLNRASVATRLCVLPLDLGFLQQGPSCTFLECIF